MYNKKAQSQIITTILIILLVLAAIIIVWQVIQGTVEDGADEIEAQSACLGLRLEITNIDIATNTITIRPTKDIDGYQAYVDGAVFGAKGTTVIPALTPEPITDTDGILTISADQEIEVIAIIDGAACPGAKKTAE